MYKYTQNSINISDLSVIVIRLSQSFNISFKANLHVGRDDAYKYQVLN